MGRGHPVQDRQADQGPSWDPGRRIGSLSPDELTGCHRLHRDHYWAVPVPSGGSLRSTAAWAGRRADGKARWWAAQCSPHPRGGRGVSRMWGSKTLYNELIRRLTAISQAEGPDHRTARGEHPHARQQKQAETRLRTRTGERCVDGNQRLALAKYPSTARRSRDPWRLGRCRLHYPLTPAGRRTGGNLRRACSQRTDRPTVISPHSPSHARKYPGASTPKLT